MKMIKSKHVRKTIQNDLGVEVVEHTLNIDEEDTEDIKPVVVPFEQKDPQV